MSTVNLPITNRPTTPQRNTRQRISSTPTPAPTKALRGSGKKLSTPTRTLAPPAAALSKKFSTSNPDLRSIGGGVATPDHRGNPQSGLRAPNSRMMRGASGQSFAIRRSSSRSSLGNHPVSVPMAPRSQSVEPSSNRSHLQDHLYSPTNYQNGSGDNNPSLFSFLPNLNFGSPEPEGMNHIV